MKARRPIRRAEALGLVALSLGCLLPLGVALIIERRAVRPLERTAQEVPAPIKVSAKTLAKYKEVVPLGGTGYVRLGEQWEQEEQKEEEGAWSIYVTGHNPRPIEAHGDTPQGWRVDFVEELPAWPSSGARTIGVRVTVPRGARAAIANGATAGIFHTRNGVQIYYSESFSVVTHGKARKPFDRRAGRAPLGNQRAHVAAPGR